MDYSKLKQGDYISVSELEQEIGISSEYQKYMFRIMKISSDISKYLTKKLEKEVVTVIDSGAIRILEDFEASEYLSRGTVKGIRKIYSSVSRKCKISLSDMTNNERDIHRKKLMKEQNLKDAMHKEILNSEFWKT